MDWEYKEFGEWLRVARARTLPTLSQEAVAERIGSTQARVSRWELERPNTDPPSLDQCLALADLFEVDFIDLATMCGRWNERIERKVLVSLAEDGVAKNRLLVSDVLGLTTHQPLLRVA